MAERLTPAGLLCIAGPTASGKSSLAERLASLYDAEIVSADSMQVYRGMDIGTAKIPASQRSCPYHGIDLVNPGEPYSAALFQAEARAVIDRIIADGKLAILCGGTGFYIQAVLYEMDFPKGDQEDNPVRAHYRAFAEEHGVEALYALLEERDPKSAALIHPNNVRRVIRAFELMEDGTTYADENANLRTLPRHYPTAPYIGLQVDPAILNERIDLRIDEMMDEGLLDEVRHLLDLGFEEGLTAQQAIGYKELVDIAKTSGEPDPAALMEAVEQIKTATHRYAKRQRSWFRRDASIQWIQADNGIDDVVVNEACRIVEAALGGSGAADL